MVLSKSVPLTLFWFAAQEEIDHVQASELQKRKSDLEVIVEFLSRHDGTGPKLTSKTTDKDGPSNP